MRIYYFGELIEDTNDRKNTKAEQTKLHLENAATEEKKSSLDSIGDLLKELDLSTEIYRPFRNFDNGGGLA